MSDRHACCRRLPKMPPFLNGRRLPISGKSKGKSRSKEARSKYDGNVQTAAERIKGYEKEREALLIWIKRRETGWKERAMNEADQGEVKAYYTNCARAEAYKDVWRQILFPGKSVEDGTLSQEEYSKAVAEWQRKANMPEEARGSETS